MEELKIGRKIITQLKDKIIKEIKIIDETDHEIEIEINNFHAVYNKGMNNAPQWFKTFEKKYSEDTAEQKKFNARIESKVDKLQVQVDNLEVKVDKLQVQVDNLEVQVKENTKSIKKLDSRISNLVEKNDLKE